MSSSNFFIQRLNATSFTPSSFDSKTKLMQLVTVPAIASSPTNPEIAMLQQLTSAFSSGNLAFTDSATLWLYGANVPPIWQSPFCNLSTEKPGVMDVVVSSASLTNPNNRIFNNMMASNKNTTFFVSPNSSSWILQLVFGGYSTGNVSAFYIYFNPLKNIAPADIPSVISSYCSLINNADPICFCQNNTDLCAYGAIGSNTLAAELQQTKPDDYNTLKANCAFLSPICNQWQAQTPNTYIANQIAAGSQANICGATIGYGASTPIVLSTNKGLIQQCDLKATPPPQPTPSPSPDGSGGAATANTATKTKMYVIIACVVIVLLVLAGTYYL